MFRRSTMRRLQRFEKRMGYAAALYHMGWRNPEETPHTQQEAGEPEVLEEDGTVMADGLNRVMLLGNLGADPELRATTGGQSVLRLRLATAESFLDKNRQRQERTEWHSVVVWGKRAEALSRILVKGSRVFIEGGLRTTSYDDRDGNKRYKTDVVASNIVLCGSRGGAEGSGTNRRDESPAGDPGGHDDFDGRDDDFPF